MKVDGDKGDNVLVYDANGNLIPLVIRCDTISGLVERLSVKDGLLELNSDKTDAVTVTERLPAPLIVKPAPKDGSVAPEKI